MWHGVAKRNEFSKETWISNSRYIDSTWSSKYIYSYYWAVTTIVTVGYGDITPRNNEEISLSIFIIILGSGVFAYCLNSIGSILNDINKEKEEFKSHLRTLNRYMKHKSINPDLQTRIRKYTEYVWNTNDFSEDFEEQVLNQLSDNLKFELLFDGNSKILKNISFLLKNFSDEFLVKINTELIQRKFTPEEIIFEEGIGNRCLFYVHKGEVELFANCQKRNEFPTKLGSYKTGDTFGEISFFSKEGQISGARSIGFTSLYVLEYEKFFSILKEFPLDYVHCDKN